MNRATNAAAYDRLPSAGPAGVAALPVLIGLYGT